MYWICHGFKFDFPKKVKLHVLKNTVGVTRLKVSLAQRDSQGVKDEDR